MPLSGVDRRQSAERRDRPRCCLTIVLTSDRLTTERNMTSTRAADDFVTIRARMEELRRVTRLRAADDFMTIRARIEELRHERARIGRNRDRGVAQRPNLIGVATSDSGE